jgi:hypothetical protein
LPPTCAVTAAGFGAATCSAGSFDVVAGSIFAVTVDGFGAATTCAGSFDVVAGAGSDAGAAAPSVSTEFDEFDSTFAGSTGAACAFLSVLIF